MRLWLVLALLMGQPDSGRGAEGAYREIGSLTCDRDSVTYLILYSRASMHCCASGALVGDEPYTAVLERVGALFLAGGNLEFTAYAVGVADEGTLGTNALAGRYTGASITIVARANETVEAFEREDRKFALRQVTPPGWGFELALDTLTLLDTLDVSDCPLVPGPVEDAWR